MPVGVVCFLVEVVYLDVRNTADVPGRDGDVVFFGEEEELSRLWHYGMRPGREVGENSQHGLVVFVQ